MSAGRFSFGRSAVKSRSTRLAGAGVISPSQELYLRRLGTCATSPSSAMILRTDFSDTPVLSTALILRYPYLPLDAANAPATSAPSPAYSSTPSRAWWQ